MTVRPGHIAREDITLGILAGGRATRLGGIDKAWLERGGVAQVVRLTRRFGPEAAAVLASANSELPRYALAGIEAVPDRVEDAGPMGGLDALAAACRTPWLLTMPVDLVEPLDVSNAIAWLVSEDARYVTGTVVPVDAGLLNKR